MWYFQFRYDSRVLIKFRRAFIKMTTDSRISPSAREQLVSVPYIYQYTISQPKQLSNLGSLPVVYLLLSYKHNTKVFRKVQCSKTFYRNKRNQQTWGKIMHRNWPRSSLADEGCIRPSPKPLCF